MGSLENSLNVIDFSAVNDLVYKKRNCLLVIKIARYKNWEPNLHSAEKKKPYSSSGILDDVFSTILQVLISLVCTAYLNKVSGSLAPLPLPISISRK